MWKHRSYAKAVIRQKEIKLKSTEQLVYMLLADHANEETNSTYFTTARLRDMTQCAANTVRAAIKKLEKHNLVTAIYSPGKSPIYRVHIPHGFNPGASDTSFSTVSRAYLPSHAETAAANLEAALVAIGVSNEEMAKMVYQGIEGMGAEEAEDRAVRLFEETELPPGRAIIEQLGIARNTPVGRSDSERALQRDRARQQGEALQERALDEQLDKWEEPRAGESMQVYQARLKAGFQGTDEELLAYRQQPYSALGK